MTDVTLKENLWGYGKRLKFVLDAIKAAFPDRSRRDLRILDVGCGNGSHLAIPLARHGFAVTGIDLHGPSVLEARRQASGLGNARFFAIAVDEFTEVRFDVVILSEVLEHVEEPGSLLRSSMAKLTKGGLVVVTVPNGYGEFEWDSWLYRTVGADRLMARLRQNKETRETEVASTENHLDGHIQFFTQQHIRSIFRECGLKVIREQGSSLLSGPFIGHTIGRLPQFVSWNAHITNRLPLKFASGWFFALQRTDEGTR